MTDVEIFHANPHPKFLSPSNKQPNIFGNPRSGSSYDISSEMRRRERYQQQQTKRQRQDGSGYFNIFLGKHLCLSPWSWDGSCPWLNSGGIIGVVLPKFFHLRSLCNRGSKAWKILLHISQCGDCAIIWACLALFSFVVWKEVSSISQLGKTHSSSLVGAVKPMA